MVNAHTWHEETVYKVELPANRLAQWAALESERFARPVFRSSDIQWAGPFPSRPTLAELLRALRESGDLLLLVPGSGQRPSVYALADLVNLAEGKEIIKRRTPQ